MILLPRYATQTLQNILGITFRKGSFADGLTALTEGDRFLEFKLTSSNGIVSSLNKASQTGDIAFIASADNIPEKKIIEIISNKKRILRLAKSIDVYILDIPKRKLYEIKKLGTVTSSPAP